MFKDKRDIVSIVIFKRLPLIRLQYFQHKENKSKRDHLAQENKAWDPCGTQKGLGCVLSQPFILCHLPSSFIKSV